MHKRAWLFTAILFVALIIIVACAQPASIEAPVPIMERGIYPEGTATPNGHVSRLIWMQELAATVTRVAGYPADSHLQLYANQVQPNLTATPKWDTVTTRLTYFADSTAIPEPPRIWLSLNIFEENFVVPPNGDYDDVRVPAGVPTVMYYTTPAVCKDAAPNYASPIFRDWYDSLVINMLQKYESEPAIAGYLLELGAIIETINVKTEDAVQCPNSQPEFEKYVTCDQYWDWIEHALGTYRQYTTKQILFPTHEKSCASVNEWKSAATSVALSHGPTATVGPPDPYALPTATPMYLTYLSKALQPVIWDAYQTAGAGYTFGKMELGPQRDEIGGAAFGSGFGPTAAGAGATTAEKTSYLNDMVYSAIAHHADQILMSTTWGAYMNAEVWNAITSTLGTNATNSSRAWIRFRSPESGKIVAATTYQDVPGPFTHLINTPVNITPTPACLPAVGTRVAGTGGSQPPALCKIVNPTGMPEARNTWMLSANKPITIDIADTWQYSQIGDAVYRIELTYLNSGSGYIDISTKNAAGTTITNTITKNFSPPGTPWLTYSYTTTTSMQGVNDIKILPRTSVANLYKLQVDYVSGGTTHTPTSTVSPVASFTPSPPPPTATDTPTSVPSAVPSPTGTLTDTPTSTPSNTPSPTGTLTASPTPTPSATRPSITVTSTAPPTATGEPRTSLNSPMETAYPENWTGQVVSNAAISTVVAPNCVSGNCWQWSQDNTSNGIARVYNDITTAYRPNLTPNASLHMSFAIKVVETPSAAINVFNWYDAGALASNPILKLQPRSSGDPWTLQTGIDNATFSWDMTDDAWHTIDIYADQQPYNYRLTMTPSRDEVPFAVSVDGTPLPTPTGIALPYLAVATDALTTLRWHGEENEATYKYNVDSVLVEVCKSSTGVCQTPTPNTPIAVYWTVTASPTATATPIASVVPSYTPSSTPTASNTPSPTPSPTPSHTPVAIAGSASRDSITNSIYKSLPDSNYQTAETEYVQYSNGEINNALLLWPNLSVPYTASHVTTATLTLYPTGFLGVGGTYMVPIELVEMGRQWNPEIVTWNDSGYSAWFQSGALGIGDTRSDSPQRIAYVTSATTPITFDVTESVQRLLFESQDNFGWRLRILNPGTTSWLGLGFASDRYFDINQRPSLDVQFGYPVTPTPSPTASNTPTVRPSPTPTATGTLTNTPTPTSTTTPPATATATPTRVPWTGIQINEVCPAPSSDFNLDGAVSSDDRYIELYNGSENNVDMYQGRLEFNYSDAYGVATTKTFIFPRGATMFAEAMKVIFSEDMFNTVNATKFTMPQAATVSIYDAGGVLQDTRYYNYQGANVCWLFENNVWTVGNPSPGY